ncbi:MAG: hypothetical protein ACI8U0_000978 [Flavobacteriales bacterium]|jgi:hypothetical protein
METIFNMRNNLFFSIFSLLIIGSASAQLSFTNNSSLLSNSNLLSDHAIGVVDMNGDGKDDIVHTDDGDAIYYSYQGEPGGMFNTVFVADIEITSESSAYSWGLAVGDLNNDGINELVTGGKYNGIYVITDNNGTFESNVFAVDDIFLQGVNTYDIDNDGLLDIFACDDVGLSDIYINDGAGTYTLDYNILNPVSDTESDYSGNYGSVFTDIDNNGHCDLYIAKCRQGVQNSSDPRRINLAYMNDGLDSWTSEGEARGIDSGDQTWLGAFGDIDNDGDMDLFLGNHDVPNEFLLNDGDGNFTEATDDAGLAGVFNFTPYQGVFADFDNDGFLDFILTGGDNCAFAMNNGDGTFDMEFNLVDAETNSIALGDLNQDGFLDMATTSGGYGGWGNSQNDQLFFNDGNDNNFVMIALEGVESNINGIGSRITIDGAWGSQIRDVKSGQSYGIQNSLTSHFGLGTSNVIDQISVSWPSGNVDTFTNINGSSWLTITEGGGISVGIEDVGLNADHLTLFPNPTTDYIQINSNISDRINLIEVFDAAGRMVISESLNGSNDKVNVQDLANGSYNYKINNDSKVVFSGTFVKE